MTAIPNIWANIHPSVFHNTAGPLRATVAQMRPGGALRYRCPVNGSLVLVTDEVTLAELDRPRARLRCIDCGEMHMLTQDDEKDSAADLAVDGDVTIPTRGAIVEAMSKL